MENEKILRYSDFGAKGDGVTDDFESIKKTHEEANKTGAKILADAGKTYNLGVHSETIEIMSDCQWTDATFIIDDRNIGPDDAERKTNVFRFVSEKSSFTTDKIKSLAPGQANVGTTFDTPCLLHICNSNHKQYIRFGINQNPGSSMQEVILVDKDGNVDKSTPVMWDYKTVTSCVCFPVDDKPVTVDGGTFITYANRAPREYTYYSRGFNICRSNVTIKNIVHLIKDETDTGAPYSAFFNLSNCNNVLMENVVLTGHKTYCRALDERNHMGTYEIGGAFANNIVWRNVTQTNDINNNKYWGVLGTNYCKNMVYDHCKLSRFDAHSGIYNASILNSEIGYMHLSVVGMGTLRVENTTMVGNTVVALRGDYGSTWQGDVILKNITIRNTGDVILVGGSWTNHNFGYTCYLPQNITIDGLKIADESKNIYVLGNFATPGVPIDEPLINGEENKNVEVITKKIILKSNKENYTYNISQNPIFAKISFVKE